jgi:hypothetical protein
MHVHVAGIHSVPQAMDYARECRPFINPNPGFLKHLGEFEVCNSTHFSRTWWVYRPASSFQAREFGSTTIRFPQDEPLTVKTVYEWLQDDGTWKPRVVNIGASARE